LRSAQDENSCVAVLDILRALFVDEPIRIGWLEGEPAGDVDTELDGVEKLLVADIVGEFGGEYA